MRWVRRMRWVPPTHDLLDDVGRRVEVDETLVDAHLVAVPGLGTLTTRGLAGDVLEDLGGETDGALDAEVTVLGAVDEVGADWVGSAGVGR